MFRLIILLVFSYSDFAFASDHDRHPGTLSIDQAVPRSFEFQCDHDDNVDAEASDFEIMDYVLMSAPNGERRALVTLRNKARGQRLLQRRHIVAVLGNCRYRFPRSVEARFAAEEELTVNLDFGVLRFPILQLRSSN